MKETINIDGKEYVLKESLDVNKKVCRFEYKIEAKLLKYLNKYFKQYNEASEEYLINKNMGIVDPANVTLIYAHKEEGKRLLSKFCDIDDNYGNVHKIPNHLKYKSEKDEENVSKFSLDYLSFWMDFLKLTSDGVKVSTKRDSPIKLESEEFTIILAPRIDDSS